MEGPPGGTSKTTHPDGSTKWTRRYGPDTIMDKEILMLMTGIDQRMELRRPIRIANQDVALSQTIQSERK